jgi:tetratricopeptide (TPR) repeat protein
MNKLWNSKMSYLKDLNPMPFYRCLVGVILRSLIVIYIFWGVFGLSPLYALQSPHPVELYEKGNQELVAYQGQPENLIKAQNQFLRLLEKFPESPLGYLGMSRIYTIDSYRYSDVYDMEKIRDLALPFAIKALELGPSVRAVHEHYSQFEEIFTDFSDYKNRVQKSLSQSPQHPETYYAVATFIRDQNEYSKALDYYKAALEMNPGEDLKVRILKRIGFIYLHEMNEPEKAVEYCNLGLKLQDQSPVLNEYLGVAYLKMQRYSDAILMFTKSVNLLPTTFPEFHLWEAKGYLAEKEGKIE